MSKDYHFPNISLVQSAFLYSVRFLLMHPVYIYRERIYIETLINLYGCLYWIPILEIGTETFLTKCRLRRSWKSREIAISSSNHQPEEEAFHPSLDLSTTDSNFNFCPKSASKVGRSQICKRWHGMLLKQIKSLGPLTPSFLF